MASFFDKLAARVAANDSLLCVGLDPTPQLWEGFDRTPARAALALNKHIIEATKDLVCAYKPNIAFYEALGLQGFGVLTNTLALIPDDIPVILDAKRADVASTSEGYARFVFDVLGVDAVTVNPYLGGDALAPFLAHRDKGIFILCRTSNPGARDLQDLEIEGVPLYQHVGHLAQEWNTAGNVGMVMGATYISELAWARQQFPSMWFLVPGIGAQGGNLEAAVQAGLTATGSGILIASSRGIMGAADPRQAATALRDAVNKIRNEMRRHPEALPPKDLLWKKHLEDLAVALYNAGCVQFGTFTLKSGQVSPIYFDLRRLTADPSLLRMVAHAYRRLLAQLSFDRLAAIPYAGLPIGTAVALDMNRPLIYPRREVKTYGTAQAIEGSYKANETVVVIDDVITTGTSKIEAVEPLRKAGLKVTDIVVLIDREQGGVAELASYGLRVHSVLSMTELLDILVRRGCISADDYQRVRAFLADGGRHG